MVRLGLLPVKGSASSTAADATNSSMSVDTAQPGMVPGVRWKELFRVWLQCRYHTMGWGPWPVIFLDWTGLDWTGLDWI